jgi:hypothetical protein
MTDDITNDLALLDDWLAGKGYGEEAGLAMRAMDLIRKQADEIEKLRAALSAVIADIEDYERANNLHPNPGKSHCWESVRAAKAALEKE